MRKRTVGAVSLGVGALLFALPAVAEIKWQMSGSGDCGSSCGSAHGNTRNFNSTTAGNPSVSANAWSNTGNGGSLGTGTLESAYLGLYSGGLGVKNRDGGSTSPNTGDSNEWQPPEHGVDNEARYDSVLFTFKDGSNATPIELTHVQIGWMESGKDSDITVLAYTGAGTPTLTGGKTYGSLDDVGQGWTHVGDYSNLGVNEKRAVNEGDIASSWWLIMTYNPAYGGTFASGASDSKYYDYVKLVALYGDRPHQVPEPHALLLVGTALAGLWATRRRRIA